MTHKDIEARRKYQREYQEAWREANHEKVLASMTKYREVNRDKINENFRKAYHENPEPFKEKRRNGYDPEYARRYYLENKERFAERGKQYRAENKEIQAARSKKWFNENKDRKHELGKLWQNKFKDTINEKRKKRVWDLKLEVWSRYGTICNCCGEPSKEFLTIDHINGGGNKHRKELRSNGSQNIYRWLKRNDFPEGYRVLCMNCNFAHGMYGYCPHELNKET